MSQLKALLIVSRFTFLEILKSRIILNTVFIGFGILLVSYVASELSLGLGQRVVLDVGLGIINISILLIAAFFGVNLVSEEIQSRTVYMILSRPVERWVFILGKSIGLCGVLLLNTAIISGQTLMMYFSLFEENLPVMMIEALLFMFMEGVIIMLISVIFSLISNKVLTIIITFSFYLMGHSARTLIEMGFFTKHPNWEKALSFYTMIFPELRKLNLKSYILYGPNLDFSQLLNTGMYGGFYICFLLLIACFIFQRKELS